MESKVKFSRNAFVTLAASVAVAAILVLPGRTLANTFAYGTIGPIGGPALLGIGSGGHTPLGAFTDTWTFTVAGTAPTNNFYVGAEVVTGNSFGVTFSSVGISGPSIYAPVLFSNTTDFSLPLSLTQFVPGAYTMTVVGNTTVNGGFYNAAVNFNSAPIPEPETYAMMLAGLGLMGLVARRRKQKDAA